MFDLDKTPPTELMIEELDSRRTKAFVLIYLLLIFVVMSMFESRHITIPLNYLLDIVDYKGDVAESTVTGLLLTLSIAIIFGLKTMIDVYKKAGDRASVENIKSLTENLKAVAGSAKAHVYLRALLELKRKPHRVEVYKLNTYLRGLLVYRDNQ